MKVLIDIDKHKYASYVNDPSMEIKTKQLLDGSVVIDKAPVILYIISGLGLTNCFEPEAVFFSEEKAKRYIEKVKARRQALKIDRMVSLDHTIDLPPLYRWEINVSDDEITIMNKYDSGECDYETTNHSSCIVKFNDCGAFRADVTALAYTKEEAIKMAKVLIYKNIIKFTGDDLDGLRVIDLTTGDAPANIH